MKLGILLCLIVYAGSAVAQTGTDIYLLDLKHEGDIVEVSNPLNVTNRAGYDNQPSFFDKGKKILFTSMSEDQQTEIKSYDVKSGKINKVTQTTNSEYSPITFAGDKFFSCITAEKNGDQRLWQYDLKGKHGKPIFDNIKFVGYHSWIDEFRLALFIVGEPNSLQIANRTTGNTLFVTDYIGRCIHKMPGSESIIYVDKNDSTNWTINTLNPTDLSTNTIIDTKQGSEDFCILKDGTLLMGDGKSIFKYNPTLDVDWTKVVDLNELGIKNAFTRMAVNENATKLAIVVNE